MESHGGSTVFAHCETVYGRFRSVREAQEREQEARNRGEVLPTEKRFDSNCITPGTGFMVRLNAQLRYFVARKISTDPLWQGLRVILSGHDVSGRPALDRRGCVGTVSLDSSDTRRAAAWRTRPS